MTHPQRRDLEAACVEPGCRTRVRGEPRRCTPHEETHQARGHPFHRADLPTDCTAVERIVHLATEPSHQRCQLCGGRRSRHQVPEAPA